jgi:hypothetical protein
LVICGIVAVVSLGSQMFVSNTYGTDTHFQAAIEALGRTKTPNIGKFEEFWSEESGSKVVVSLNGASTILSAEYKGKKYIAPVTADSDEVPDCCE